ncbi:MAG: hypothetical protein AAFW83_10890 [Pseudomonadota bacterium]
MENHDGLLPGTIWPDDGDDDAIQIREVYARYGLAMYTAQTLEHGMVNALMGFTMLPSAKDFAHRQSWETSVDEYYESEFSKTFGKLVRALSDIKNIPNNLIERLCEANRVRNMLAHAFFREYADQFLSTHGRKEMIGCCENAIATFQNADEALDTLVKPIYEKYGITEGMLEKEFKRLRS